MVSGTVFETVLQEWKSWVLGQLDEPDIKICCCYICHRAINSFNLNKGSTKVQILTAFLFHSLHHVALRIALTSITCLPLQGLPTVDSVCPLGFNIGIPPALTTTPLKLLLSQQRIRKLCLICVFVSICQRTIQSDNT